MSAIIRFVKNLFWEFIQNLPLGVSFIFGYILWEDGNYIPSFLILLICSIISSLLIRYTERFIEDSTTEKWILTFTNFFLFFMIQLSLVFYLYFFQEILIMDFLIGLIFGILFGVIQGRFTKEGISIKHTIACALSIPLVLIGIRVLFILYLPIINILFITLMISVLITLLDYSEN